MNEERSFIEVQFPVSKVSKESYKERKAVAGQTLTGLGKWWGRKPLILVRAAILGLLMPVSNDPAKDRQVFLQLLTMDEAGQIARRNKKFTASELYEMVTPAERNQYFEKNSTDAKPVLKKMSDAAKDALQLAVFSRLSYDEKLDYCARPEQISGPTEDTWKMINLHLGTNADSIAALIEELGQQKFGHTPKVGDSFCGGGSVPFEAARIGCDAYAGDLNPVATFLTWSALHLIGGGRATAEKVKAAQEVAFAEVDRQITQWGIEHNARGWRADAYLYCAEVTCPECGWNVPLAPFWLISEKNRTVGVLVPNLKEKRFDVEIRSGVSLEELQRAKETGTARDSCFVCPTPDCHANKTPISLSHLRGDQRKGGGTEYGLRLWDNEDIVPREGDVIGERLYCIRWVETVQSGNKVQQIRHYLAPDADDLAREEKILQLIGERFADWQERGVIPNRQIEPGDKTDEPIRTRGWTHWHHLFNPRQLLVNGLFNQAVERSECPAALLLLVGKLADNCCRLSQWLVNQSAGLGGAKHAFANQALNPLLNYACRSFSSFKTLMLDVDPCYIGRSTKVYAVDARETEFRADLWITDPPYADAVNYHELSEFFLAWYDKNLKRVFPEWYSDSKRALAITGEAESFRKSMAECYRKLAEQMPDNGLQLVMFTHQSAAVWADLALILWAAGLRVTAAWCIATETNSALRVGNYVQGTVLLVLRKQITEDTAFLDEIYPRVDEEVRRQLAEMSALDDKEDPNFSDTDYQLAAYAAALRVLTSYRRIEEIDVQRELVKVRAKGEVSPLEEVIREAVKIACNYQIPNGLDKEVWRGLSADERFYIKGLELESHGEYRTGAYQEFAKGFGIKEYSFMLSSGKANQTRLKTASEFAGRNLGGEGFASSLTRHALYAVRETAASGETGDGRHWFRNELGARYWAERKNLVGILNYFASFAHSANMPQWQKDASAAKLLAVAVENDHV